jgi:hypothetical protein
MPAKSKHGKGKRYQQANKTQYLRRQGTVTSPEAGAAAAPLKTSALAPATGTVKAAGATASTMTDRYAHVPGDLRNIGILTGIIFIILVVLKFILP